MVFGKKSAKEPKPDDPKSSKASKAFPNKAAAGGPATGMGGGMGASMGVSMVMRLFLSMDVGMSVRASLWPPPKGFCSRSAYGLWRWNASRRVIIVSARRLQQ